jgi:hypothetical protein
MKKFRLTITDVRAVVVSDEQQHVYTGKFSNRNDGMNWVMGEALRQIMDGASEGPIEIELNDDRVRAKLEQEYECKHEHAPLVITQPGKFEGEPIWVPYYYGLVLDGCTSGSFIFPDETIDYFELDETDYEIWPELRSGGDCDPETDPCVAIALTYRSDGFVIGTHYNAKEWEREKAHMEELEGQAEDADSYAEGDDAGL